MICREEVAALSEQEVMPEAKEALSALIDRFMMHPSATLRRLRIKVGFHPTQHPILRCSKGPLYWSS